MSQNGPEQSMTFAPSVIRLIEKGSLLPDSLLSTITALPTAAPTNWKDIHLTGKMPIGFNTDKKGKLNGIKVSNANSAAITDIAKREFKAFNHLAKMYRTQKNLEPSVSVFLVYGIDNPTPQMLHSVDDLGAVLRLWGLRNSYYNYLVKETRPRQDIYTLREGEVVVFHSRE